MYHGRKGFWGLRCRAADRFCAVLPGGPVTATRPETCTVIADTLPLYFPIVLIVPASDCLRGSGWLDRAGEKMQQKERERERKTWQSVNVSLHLSREKLSSAGDKLACFVPQAGATRHARRHVKNCVSLSLLRGEPARRSGARFIKPSHGRAILLMSIITVST